MEVSYSSGSEPDPCEIRLLIIAPEQVGGLSTKLNTQSILLSLAASGCITTPSSYSVESVFCINTLYHEPVHVYVHGRPQSTSKYAGDCRCPYRVVMYIYPVLCRLCVVVTLCFPSPTALEYLSFLQAGSLTRIRKMVKPEYPRSSP